MTVAPLRTRAGSRVPTATVVAASIALLFGLGALAAGITTWFGLILAAVSVTIDLVILQHHPSLRFAVVGTALGVILLVGVLGIATMQIASV